MRAITRVHNLEGDWRLDGNRMIKIPANGR
jgi:hypothetical protein